MEAFFKTAEVPMYPVRVYVAWGDSLEEANDALPAKCDGAFSDEALRDATTGALTNAREDGLVVTIFTFDTFRAGMLTHESVHVAMDVMSHVGMGSMNSTNEEAYAYVAGWFARTAVTWYNAQVEKQMASETAAKTKKSKKSGKKKQTKKGQ